MEDHFLSHGNKENGKMNIWNICYRDVTCFSPFSIFADDIELPL